MRITVRTLLSFIVAASMLSALVCMGLILNSTLKKHMLSEKRAELFKVSNDLALLAAKDYMPGINRAEMDSWAKEMGELGRYRISLIDGNGNLYGDSLVPNQKLDGTDNHGLRPEVAEALKSGHGRSLRFSTTTGREYLYAASKVDYNGAPIVLRVGAPLSSLNQVRYSLLRIYSAAAIGVLLLALALVWFGTRRLSRSFADIVSTACTMAEGNLDKRAGRRAPAELGQVASAINHLAESLTMQLSGTETSLNRLSAVLESMSDGIIVVDAQGLVIRHNRRSEEFLGRVTGKKITELRYPELAVDFEKVRSGAAPPPRLIHSVGPPEKFIEVRFSLAGEGAGEAVAVLHDLTERQALYQMRRDFVANVSHELRTPLTALMGAVEAMREKLGNSPEMKDMAPLLSILERQSSRLHDLAHDVLELARLEKKSEKSTEKLETAVLFKEVLAARQGGPGQKLENRFSMVIPEDMPVLTADKKALTGALDNLVDNALKYGEPDGQIGLRAGFSDDGIWLAVHNAGQPIAASDRPRVFERFYRGERARAGSGGTGLGLAIVKHAALAHGGTAELICPPEGGTVFIIKLPRQPELAGLAD